MAKLIIKFPYMLTFNARKKKAEQLAKSIAENEAIVLDASYEIHVIKDGDGIYIDPRPQGEWINHRNDYGHNIADCSLCGKAMQWHDEDEDGVPRYCWYCGADMRKGGTE